MKQLKIGIAAIALIAGIASSFATKATMRLGTKWTIVGRSGFFTKAQADLACAGGIYLCATQYTTFNTPTGLIRQKP